MKTKTLLTALATCTAVVAGSVNADTVLLDPLVGDGDFDNGIGNWVDLGGLQALFGTNNPTSGLGSTTYYTTDDRMYLGIDAGHTITASDSYDFSYLWRAHANMEGDEQINFVLFYTVDNAITSSIEDSISFASGTYDSQVAYNTISQSGVAFGDNDGVGKKLFAALQAGVNVNRNDYSRIDNVSLTVVPEPSSLALLGLGGLLIARRRRG